MTIDTGILTAFITIAVFILGIIFKSSSDNRKAHKDIWEFVRTAKEEHGEKIVRLETKVNGGSNDIR